MKRRAFFAMSGVVPAISMAVQDPAESPDLWTRWSEKLERPTDSVFQSTEGRLRLEVSLIREEETTSETYKVGDSEFVRYSFGDRRLPDTLHPTDGVLKTFRFYWDGQEIKVPDRFWNDVGGFRLEKCTFVEAKLAPAETLQVEEWNAGLLHPQVVLSADGGTAMVEWSIIDTDACCGHQATLRWLISRSGHIMRHRHTTPNPC
ncbi:hypothetical protein [Verrucomicrobium sp. BvORR034]|uniref:hypothetical protein n=1 Tax=Verrucomicrobium sp. BvORR034 TaxID=1396418 RepID=UPI0006790280|nr:hypothetical protein [Verrucomicrobium sp. BvORR034]